MRAYDFYSLAQFRLLLVLLLDHQSIVISGKEQTSATSGKVFCPPVAISTKIVRLLSDSSDSTFPVLCRVVSTKKGLHFYTSSSIRYSSVPDGLSKYLAPIGKNVNAYYVVASNLEVPLTTAIN